MSSSTSVSSTISGLKEKIGISAPTLLFGIGVGVLWLRLRRRRQHWHRMMLKAKGLRSSSRQPVPLVVPGIGRLPTFSNCSIAGDFVYVSGILGTLEEKEGSTRLIEGGLVFETRQCLVNIQRILEFAFNHALKARRDELMEREKCHRSRWASFGGRCHGNNKCGTKTQSSVSSSGSGSGSSSSGGNPSNSMSECLLSKIPANALQQIVKVNVYLRADNYQDAFTIYNTEYLRFFTEAATRGSGGAPSQLGMPARMTSGSTWLAMNASIEIECVALLP